MKFGNYTKAKLKFNNYTKEKLKRISEELDVECDAYVWGSDEFWFLMDLCGEIEDALREVAEDE